MAQKLEQQLSDLGSKLEQPPSTKDALVKLLKQAATCLSELDQTPATSILDSMQPLLNAVVKPELLKHQDKDVKLLVATCICEITRITAPDAPYSDDILKDIFCLIVSTFGGLRDTSGLSFGRRVVILETVAKYRSCVVMLDLECDDLVKEMFNTFFSVASDEHPESVISSMQTIMAVLLEESEDIQEDLLFSILSVLGRNKKDVTMAARKLAMNVIEQCAGKLEADIKQFLISSMSGDSKTVKYPLDYHEVIYDVYRCTPLILSGVVPYITGELLSDQLETRLKAVGLVGDLFALPGSVISEAFQPIFSEFLKRLTDRVVEVRMSVLEHVKSCLLSNPFRDEAPQIISALCDRLLDFDENVRKQVVAVISDVACHALSSVPHETVKLVAERLRDKSLLVKKYTLERLADIYRVYCMKCADGSMTSYEYDWIPGKILRSFYDKDFRSDVIESVLCGSLFPNEFSIKDKVRHWVRLFSGFDKVEIKALEKVLEQKQRLQQEMQRYLSFRQMYQDGDAPEIQKKVLFCFRIMSRSFADPAKAEENFQILDQLKDANIWKILTNLVDSNTSFHQASAFRDDLLKILGEKHRLYDFLSTLSVKSSYLLFDKEHVKELLLEAAAHKSSDNLLYTSSCMNMLVILARFSPMLLSGAEEELINFLKEDDEVIREGVLHVLAKAGGTIREQLAVSSSSIDLMLEKVCLEGSRRQAKYAVHALAAITKDDGLKSLSVLYKKLVDMLEEKTHLPAVLQSLGCIAQTAMPVFETRETQIEEFILNKILKCNSKPEGGAKASWDKRSDICSLKIFGIKTLVKSYLPVKDAHVRSGIDGLVEILRNILSFGEISNDIESSPVDKAHLRLASAKAVLRLSKHWDHKIPVDVFHLTLRTSEISYLEAKRLFLSKVHQYIKDRLLDGKYACAFLLDIFGSKPADFQEEKQNLADIIQMYHQTKARQHNIQNDANSLTAYPEYLLPYLVHALAHHSCPNVDECKDVKAFEVLYRQLYLILSMLVHRDEDVKSEANNTAVQESIFAIVSIFKSIKQSEDIVAAMSKNSYAICDLGLSITKCLAPKEYEELGLTASVPLPTVMYKPYEKKGEEDSVAGEGETWLADESVLAHFALLKLETSETIVPETAENDLLKQGEKDGNEVPLGKMIKHLKSQGTKGKKVKKEKSSSAEVGNAGNAVDILGMVREINVDNLGKSNKFESTNGHKHSPSKKSRTDLKHQRGEKRKAIDATPVPVPKRKRSLSGQSASKGRSSSSKALTNNINERKSLMNSGSDLLASCFQKNISSSSKRKGKGLDQSRKDEPNEIEEVSDHEKSNVLIETDKIDTNSDIQLSTGPMKKRKRNSMPGLTKSKFKESGKDVEELIGCKIKVWWPMDKQFYEGTVKSYDTKKNKHVVLYDDGDVEVLRLEKERWELIDNGRKTKKLNSSKSPPSRKRSGGKVKSSGGSVQDKKATKPVKGKRTPKNVMKDGKKSVSRSNYSETEDKESSDVSDAEPIISSKLDEVNSGSSEGEDAENVENNLTDGGESDNEVKSVSKEDKEGSPNPMEESDEEKPDAGERPADDRESTPQDAPKSDEEKPDSGERVADDREGSPQDAPMSDEEKQHSEEEHADESSQSSGEKEQASEEDKSDSEETRETNDVENTPPKPKKTQKNKPKPAKEDAEISDDEPLMQWKNRVWKKASKHV